MNNQKYVCCFCGTSVESSKIDITSLIIVSNWDKNQDQQQEQQFWCHMNCLKERLHKNAHLYIEDLID